MAGTWKSVYGLCQATSKRSGKPCKMMALSPGGRCTWHGGVSVGPRTVEGRARALSNLPAYRHVDEATLLERAAELIAKSEQRYARLRREADRRRGRAPVLVAKR